MFNNQILAGSSGQGGITQQSLKFNDDESQYLSWTPAAAGNRKTWTWSGWVKRGNISTSQIFFGVHDGGSQQCWLGWNSGNTIQFFSYQGSTIANVSTQAVFRDVSAWYHLVVAFDAANTTMNMYVNGVDQTLTFNTAISNTNHHINSSSYVHGLGRAGVLTGNDADMYLSDVYFIDGQALDPTSFGQFTNSYWEKKDYAGSVGTNGFHLTFQDDVVSEGFNAVTYRGTSVEQSLSGLGFSPDLVWVKNRSNVEGHNLFDSVRGSSGNYKTLQTNTTGAEITPGVTMLSTLDSDGFTLGTNGGVNQSGDSFVAWAWDAGSGSPVSNTDGSITSSVKANPSYGFSIVSYTSPNNAADQTVGHGLSQAPEVIICKNLDTTYNWDIYHSGTGSVEDTLTFTTDATRDFDVFTTTAPTSTVFGTKNNYTHAGTNRYIAYCFHSVAAYSSIGSYSGSGAAGNAITTGFEPAFVMIKATSISGEAWWMFDNTRSTTDPRTKHLRANTSGAEITDASAALDFTSTGFEHQSSQDGLNKSGTTYIYMAFADTREAAFWKDVSGQGNNWTPNNLDYRDSLIDSPANNFAVLNAVDKAGSGVLSEGNLRYATSTSTFDPIRGTTGVSSGKWYWEIYCASQSGASANTFMAGIAKDTSNISAASYFIGNDAGSYSMYFANGYKYNNGSGSAYGASSTTGDIVSIALDLDAGTLTFYKNGVSQGTAYSGLSGTFAPAYSDAGTSGDTSVVFNFGQDSTFSGARPAGGNQDDNGIGDFAYPVPSGGYLALCTANLTTPTIIDGSEHFNTVLWTGNGSHIDVGFDPEFLWYKARDVSSYGGIVDSIRGDNVYLQSYSTNAEVTSSGLLVTDSTGFTPGSAFSSNSYVSWNWKAGGTAVSNTAGSITSQVSANVDAGFSVLTYSPSGSSGSVGHGLGVTPSVVIVKRRDTTGQWVSHWTAISGANKQLYLNGTNAVDTNNISSLTSTTFTVSGWSEVATAGGSYVAYCFADVDGFSKAGSYTGNGSSNGPFIYTGFRPAFVMFKGSSIASNWCILDSERSSFNLADDVLQANGADQELTNLSDLDFLSNGIKIRDVVTNDTNINGQTYIYLAFAETPQKFANAR
jgi:hypothetical protein